MTAGWGWMTTWWGAGLAIVTLLLARSLHRVIGKICRPREENRSGTLKILSDKDDAKFEIIAVPGLGAHPYHTWEARKTPGPSAAECQTAQSPKVHLLKDLLAHDFPDAKIWNFAHESNWLIDAPVKTTAEIGKCLITEIKDKRSSPHLPIIFIGHSLGGIIIKQALCSNDSQEIVDDTSGIVFLGTPHQGSSVSVAGALLAWITGFLGSDTTLLLSLKSNDQQLSTLAASFKQCIASSNKRRQENIRISSFYETKKTYLLGLSLGVMVSQNSAVVHDDADESHSVETDHSGLNKCGGPTDALYTKLTDAVRHLKTPSLLEQADTWIRDKHYTADRLKIERLSGKLLAMNQCYINLAIVEKSGQDAGRSKEGDTARSPFTLFSRQKVEAPDKTVQVDLAAVFNERKRGNGLSMHPRRILIRGRAGVGKTTLCKKMVYDFTRGTQTELHRSWRRLFDRVLWVPLRRLKIQPVEGWNLESLFYHEYFKKTGEDEGRRLAREMSQTLLDPSNGRTLFILDGLDEVSGVWATDDYRAEFLSRLLNQPDVIVTSRPSGTVPVGVHDTDLELETIGFYPDQVKDYIEKTFTDRGKVDEVESFLQERWLIQGLVRIPIQLDALCYTWDDLEPGTIPNTMTGVYKEIELKLWKKDALRLEKKHDDKVLTEEHLKRVGSGKIELLVKGEMAFIESLAFTGLYNDEIDFSSEHLDSISDHSTSSLLPDKTLPLLSFLRTSDTSSEYRHRNYHFIHLTFQEYFAARYFVRQWKGRAGQLRFLVFGSKDTETKASPPTEFLRKHKYTARYDIFWRFVAGLLDSSGQAPEFINIIEKEPLDLLGPTHQRLVMHCLSEISSSLPTREALEKNLAQWLLFECTFKKVARLASEVEFPEMALRTALRNESSDVQTTILYSLSSRASISRSIAEAVTARLDHQDRDVRSAAVEALGQRAELPDGVLTAVAARLDDQDEDVRRAVVYVLDRRAELPDGVLTAVAARLDHQDRFVRSAAVEALGWRAELHDGVLTAVAARLDDQDRDVRGAAVGALGRRAELPGGVLTTVAARLDDQDQDVRRAAVDVLGRRAELPDGVLTMVAARLDHQDQDVRSVAVDVLGRRAELPDGVLTAVAARLDDQDGLVRRAAVYNLGRRAELPDGVLTAVAARLRDQDRLVRRAAVEALGQRAELPDGVLTAVAARLDDQDQFVRKAAVDALGQRVELPDGVLTAVAARLDDQDELVRSAAVEALGQRAELPDGVLTAVAARLDDQDYFVRMAANALLQKHREFYRTLLKGPRVASLYQILLEQSFEEQISWYFEDNNSCVNMSDDIWEISIYDQQSDVRRYIEGARPTNCPSTSTRESC